MSDGWISVRNWSKFQHYDPAKRGQPWIKDYVGQTDEDAYRELTLAQRGLLHGIRMVYQKSRCELRMDTTKLSQRLGQKVTRKTIDALIQAGFIDIVASNVLADGYQAARQPASTEGEGEKDKNPLTPITEGEDILNAMGPFLDSEDRLRALVRAANEQLEESPEW